VTDLPNWTRTDIKPSLTAYTWHGWVIDQWTDGVNVLWRDDAPIMEFGPIERLAARAAELEAEGDR
jgi:hypothetical protein